MIIPADARMQLARALQNSTSGTERAALVQAYAREWGVSEATARRHADVRIRPKRQREARYSVERDVLDQVVALWLSTGTEKYKTATMPIPEVIDVAETAGILQPGQLSQWQLKRYIRDEHITLADQRRGTPHISMASPYPNWAHLFDITRCRQWYLQHDGRLDLQSFKRGTAEYRNKDLRGGVPLYRYVIVDHTSNLPYVQYATDETVPTLLTFLYGAWARKRQQPASAIEAPVVDMVRAGKDHWIPAPFDAERYDEWMRLPELRNYYFRGLPQVLVLDRAGANQSEFTRQLCARLGIKHVLAQEARAKGAVECMMWLWETRFEARLATQPAPDLQTLNIWALDFTARWCLRAVHTRHGMTRSQAWAQIQAEQLRELHGGWPVFREATRRAPRPATVKSGEPGCGLIHYAGRTWRIPNANLIGQQVGICESPWGDAELVAQAADGTVYCLQEIKRDRWGFASLAPVIGESYKSHPTSETEQTRKRLEAVRQALPPLQLFGREIQRGDTPALLPPRQGVEISLQAVGPREITESQLTRRVRAALGGRPLTEDEGAERDRLVAGRTSVPESLVDELIAWCLGRQQADGRKVVNLFSR